MPIRPVLAAVALVAVLALAGCYGSTEPATEIGEDTATLNGRGTADNGSAQSYFSYGATGAPGYLNRSTPNRTWPAGASGPIRERVDDLLVATQHSFQLCGGDLEPPRYACAQTRTFTTATPSGDYVAGDLLFYVRAGTVAGRFNVRSSLASGAAPRGTLEVPMPPLDPLVTGRPIEVFTGGVTCLAVQGDRAVIGARGFDREIQAPGYFQFTVVDGGDRYGFERLRDAVPTCANPRPETEFFTPDGSRVVVRDVP